MAIKPGHLAPTVASVTLAQQDHPRDEVELQLDPGLTITGQVFEAPDRPAAGQTIYARPWGLYVGSLDRCDYGDFRYETTSNDDGHFSIGGLLDGEYRLAASGDFEEPVRVRPGGKAVQILTSRVLLEGHLRFEGGKVPPWFEIEVDGQLLRLAGASFFLMVPSLPEHELIVTAPGFIPFEGRIRSTESAPVEIVMKPVFEEDNF